MIPVRLLLTGLIFAFGAAAAAASDNTKSSLDKNALLGSGLSPSALATVNMLNGQLAMEQDTLTQAQAGLTAAQQQLPAAQQRLGFAQQVYAASQDQDQSAHQALRGAAGVDAVRDAFAAVDAADSQLGGASAALNSAQQTYTQLSQAILQDMLTIQQMQSMIANTQAQIDAVMNGASPPGPTADAGAAASDSGNVAALGTAIASIQGAGQADSGGDD